MIEADPQLPAPGEPVNPKFKPSGDIVGFMPDEDLDFTEEMTPEEMSANGGRLIISGALRLLAWEDYDAYLLTNHWQQIRARTYKIHGKRCTVGVECSGPLDVHHRTYDSLGDEKPEDTEVLCREHHTRKHEHARQQMRNQLSQLFNRPI